MRRAVAAVVLAALAATGATATDLPSDFVELRAKDERVQRLGYRLSTGNAAFCTNTLPSLGLFLHDVAAYGYADGLRDAFMLTGDIAVHVVVPGGPADGALRGGESIARIGGADLSTLAFDRDKKWQRLVAVNELLEADLADDGRASFGLPGGRIVELAGTPACATRYEVADIKKRAAADGERVVIGDEFPGFAYADPEFAAVIAHELAHNVLGHRALLDAQGRKRKLVRATEREADRLAPWLLANAGFDPAASLRFMQTWGPDHSGGWLLRKRTHDGWDERAETIAAEVALVTARMAADGKADWATHFAREPETQAD